MPINRWISTSDNSYSTDANWSTGAKPVTGDTIIFDGTGTADMTSGLNQSAVTGVTLIITHANTAKIGSDTAGVATYFQIGASTAIIGRNDGGIGNGSTLVLLDFGSTTNVTRVDQTSSASANTKYPALSIKGTATTITVGGGSVGIAQRPAETATVTLKTVKGLIGSTPQVFMGSGVTQTLVIADAGDVMSLTAQTCAEVRVTGGRYIYEGTGAHTLVNVDDGTMIYSGTGTVTTLNVRGECDFSHDARAKTVTTATVNKNGILNIDNGVPGGIVFTNAINYPDGLDDCDVRTPAGVKGTLTNI